MARMTTNGRVSVSQQERETITSAFAVLAAGLKSGALDEGRLLDEAAGNLDLAGDFEYPEGLEHKPEMTNAEFSRVETARSEHRRERAPQLLVDTAAEFGVRLELAGLTNKKW